MKEMYFSIDCEFEGDVPGINSLLSVGIVAMHHETQENVDTFYAVLERLPGSVASGRTMDWWDTELDAFKLARTKPRPPADVMRDLDAWVRRVTPDGVTPVLVAYPITTEFAFIAHYLHQFVGTCVFGFCGPDMGSVAFGLLKDKAYSEMKKKNWPAEWQTDLPHTHHAGDDALEQADIWRKILKTRATVPAPSFTTKTPRVGSLWYAKSTGQPACVTKTILVDDLATLTVFWEWQGAVDSESHALVEEFVHMFEPSDLEAWSDTYLRRVVTLARAELSLPTESVLFQAGVPGRVGDREFAAADWGADQLPNATCASDYAKERSEEVRKAVGLPSNASHVALMKRLRTLVRLSELKVDEQ